MNKIKQILVTLVMLAFTVLNIYKIEMSAPIEEVEYYRYANVYLMLTGICFIIVCGSYISGYKNRIIESLLIINIGVYTVLAFKAFLNIAGENKYYDWTFAGLSVIYAVFHLFPTKHRKNN